MKSLFLFCVISIIAGCTIVSTVSSQKRKKIIEHYSVVSNVVYYDSIPFAELQAMTWSLDGGELVREMNFKLLDKHDVTLIGGMIDFLSDRHQGDEIEVEFEVEHNSELFKL